MSLLPSSLRISCAFGLFTLATFASPAAFAQDGTLNLPPAPLDATSPQTPPAGITVAPSEKGEVRALWVVRDTLTSPAKIKKAVTLAKRHGFNTLFVQVRGRGDAFYDSRFEPRSEELADAPRDFDPLQTVIDEGHKAGLEVHAWMNTFLAWSKSRKPYSGRHVVRQHPEWLARDGRGRVQFAPTNECEGAFLDPTQPEVREFVKNVFLDVATRYDVDGIHFDYVRYAGDNYPYSPASLRNFRSYLGERLAANSLAYADERASFNKRAYTFLFPSEWRAFRQWCISETVRQVSEEAHRVKPNLIVSAAVFPNYRVASRDKGQAWHEWLRDGYLDAACPMAYNRSTPLVAQQIKDAVDNSYGKLIIAGVGAWQMSASSAIAKAQVSRKLGAGGLNFFSYDGVTKNGRTEAYLSRVRTSLFASRSGGPNWRRGAKKVQTADGQAPGGADAGGER